MDGLMSQLQQQVDTPVGANPRRAKALVSLDNQDLSELCGLLEWSYAQTDNDDKNRRLALASLHNRLVAGLISITDQKEIQL